MSSISRLGSFSTPNLADTKDIEVKHRRHHIDREDYDAREDRGGRIAGGASRDLPHPRARPLPTAARFIGNERAMELRRSVSMQAISQPERGKKNRAPVFLQELLENLNTLSNHIAGISVKSNVQRSDIRRKVMSAQVQEFTLDKSLERILYAMYKTKNDLKQADDRSPEDDVFRQAVLHALYFGRPLANATAFNVLRNKYKVRRGMGNTAAAVTADASMLAFPVARAVQKLMRRDGNQGRGEPATGMHDPAWHRQPATRIESAAEAARAGVDIDAFFTTPRDSIASNNDEGGRAWSGSPATVLKEIGKLVKERGAPVALAAMDIEAAIVLSEFRGDIDHLKEMMGAQASVEEGAAHSSGS